MVLTGFGHLKQGEISMSYFWFNEDLLLPWGDYDTEVLFPNGGDDRREFEFSNYAHESQRIRL
jgi:hypothetical protein